jgi:NAD(P)-dependent dehydrogenase (short-subunit alcohol dehydrogenase family)
MSLKGKHALITGSSRGIGRGIALKLGENGVKVAIHYVQNERRPRRRWTKFESAEATGSSCRQTS